MNDINARQKLRILILDDNRDYVSNLKDAFERCNKGDLKLPRHHPLRFMFDTQEAGNANEITEAFKRIESWDAIIIDRKFEQEQAFDKEFNRPVLRALQDLRFRGVAVVLTGHPDEDNTDEILSMRLGAWDYLNKGRPRYAPNSFVGVIVSILDGLEYKRSRGEKATRDHQAHEFIIEHYGEVYTKCKGHFAAFEQKDGQWQVEPVAQNASLFGLYVDLDGLKRDPDQLHLAWIQE